MNEVSLFNQNQASANNSQSVNIPILKQMIGESEVNAIDCKELYKQLVGEDVSHYARWLKDNLFDNEFFVENVDYIIIATMAKNATAGRPSKKAIVTLDVAKELCMLSKCKNGKSIREYFIECEKQLMQKIQIDMSDPKVLLNQMIELAQKQLVLLEENEKLTIENKEQKQVIEYQSDNLKSYKQVEKARRSKAELKSTFNRKVRLLAEQKFNKDYPKTYNYIYGVFANSHNIGDKINMNYISKNIDYLAECVEIVLSELD